MKWVASLIVIGTLTLLAQRSEANPATSAQATQEAEAFAATGDFLNAAARYRAAYAADPKPALICNVGVAYYKAKDASRAQLYLGRCLERGTGALDAAFTESVRAVLSAVENTLRTGEFTPIDIGVEPAGATVSISGFSPDEAFVGSRVIWLPFGKHAITATHEGYASKTIEVEARSHTTTAAAITLTPDARVVVVPEPRTRLIERDAPSKLPAVIASAATVAAIVVAGFAYSYAHERADLARFALTPEVYAADRAVVERWNRMMAISSAIAIAGAGVSGFLWYRAFQTESRVELDASADHATLTFARAW